MSLGIDKFVADLLHFPDKNNREPLYEEIGEIIVSSIEKNLGEGVAATMSEKMGSLQVVLLSGYRQHVPKGKAGSHSSIPVNYRHQSHITQQPLV